MQYKYIVKNLETLDPCTLYMTRDCDLKTSARVVIP